MNRHPLDDVFKPHGSTLLSEHRERVGIPLHKNLIRFDLLSVFDQKMRAVDERVALAVSPVSILHHQGAAAIHDDECPVFLLDDLNALELRGPSMLTLQRRLLGNA